MKRKRICLLLKVEIDNQHSLAMVFHNFLEIYRYLSRTETLTSGPSFRFQKAERYMKSTVAEELNMSRCDGWLMEVS